MVLQRSGLGWGTYSADFSGSAASGGEGVYWLWSLRGDLPP
jgi:hypothetical protein